MSEQFEERLLRERIDLIESLHCSTLIHALDHVNEYARGERQGKHTLTVGVYEIGCLIILMSDVMACELRYSKELQRSSIGFIAK